MQDAQCEPCVLMVGQIEFDLISFIMYQKVPGIKMALLSESNLHRVDTCSACLHAFSL